MQFNIPAEHKHASGVYIIRNSVNIKVYVGSAKSFWPRFRRHRTHLADNKHHCHHLQNFCNKYGAGVLVLELLEVTETEKIALIGCEQKWMDFYLSYKLENGFNASPTAGSSLGVKHSEATRAARIGIPRSAETRRRISEAHKGKIQKPFTPEQRERHRIASMAAAHRRAKEGKTYRLNPEQEARRKEAARAANTGRRLSDEVKQKLSLERKGKKRALEVVQKRMATLAAFSPEKKLK